MPREYPRAKRVGEQVKRLLAELIRREVKDPRVGLVTVTAVEVSTDLTHARVYFTPFAGVGDGEVALEALRHASGFLRRELCNSLRLRVAPELEFRLDESVERGAKLTSLIDEAMADDRRRAEENDPE